MSTPSSFDETPRSDEPLPTISQLRECLFDLEWHLHRRASLERKRESIVSRLHTMAVARVKAAAAAGVERAVAPRVRR